jgi:hypothetical protein
MGAAGRERARRWHADRYADLLEALLERLRASSRIGRMR